MAFVSAEKFIKYCVLLVVSCAIILGSCPRKGTVCGSTGEAFTEYGVVFL